MSTRIPLLLIGGGGHCKVCIDVVEQGSTYTIVGIIDVPSKIGETILGYPIVGSDEDIPTWIDQGVELFLTVGHLRSNQIRKNIDERIVQWGGKYATLISPHAYVSKHATIEEGTIIMHGAVVQPDVTIGKHTIVNTGSLIEHDCVVGHHCHVSTHAVLNGNCMLTHDVFVGSNATLKQGIHITASPVIIGAGAVVVNHIHQAGIYAGVPAQPLAL